MALVGIAFVLACCNLAVAMCAIPLWLSHLSGK